MWKDKLREYREYFIISTVCFLTYFNVFNAAMFCDDSALLIPHRQIQLNGAIVTNLLIAVNRLCNSPFVYHSINILLHIAGCILVFLFLKLFFEKLPSLIGSLLFAVLPIHTENVSWVSGISHLTEGIAILGVFLLFHHRKYILSLLVFTLALFPTINPFVCPVIIFIFIYLWLFDRRKEIVYLALFILVAIFIFLCSWNTVISRVIVQSDGLGTTWINPARSFGYITESYLGLILFPSGLTLYHQFYKHIGTIDASYSILIVSSLLLMLSYYKAKPIFLGIAAFFLFLIPSYSPIPMGWIVAERYAYIPSIFVCVLLAWFLNKNSKILPVCLVIIGLYASITIDRNSDYKTEERFWRSTLAKSQNSPQAWNNMGVIYAKESNVIKSLQCFDNALMLKPDFEDAKVNLEVVKETLKQGIKINY